MAGVAGPFEPVDGDGVERVDGRKLVDHEHPAAQPCDAHELSQHELGSRDVMQGAQRAGEVEFAVRVREPSRIGLGERRVAGCPLPGELEQLRHAVDADDLSHERGKRERERPRSAADVDRALVAARAHELADALRKLGCALVLPRHEPLGRAGEAVLNHRRRSSAPVPGRSRSRRRART